MDKKTIIGISAAAGAAVLLLIGWFSFRVWSNTQSAKAAVSEFAELLQAGDLDTLSLKYYAYSESENSFLTDENGQAQVQLVTKQQFAERYGTDAVKSTEKSAAAQLLEVLMKHSQVKAAGKIAFGNKSKMSLMVEQPDLKTWLLELSEEDLAYLNAMSEGQLEDLETRLELGEIPQTRLQLTIPMIKQNGSWRFQVTEEMEQAFFGGLYEMAVADR